jgi:hypothetical protein
MSETSTRATGQLPGPLARWTERLDPTGSLGRVPGRRTARTTAAAVLAFVVADALHTSPQPVLAPLTALLVARLTTYETVTSSVDRVVSVVAGVVVAVTLASVVGLTWWSLGAAIALSLVLGQLLRLGSNRLEVAISAMIVLAVGGNEHQAVGRVVETLVGAAVGVGVSLVVAPPLQVRPAAEALTDLSGGLAEVLRGLATDLRADWDRVAADRWLDRARALGPAVGRADRALDQAEQSARLHPRGGVARSASPRLRTGLSGLEHGYVALRSLCRALLDRTYWVPEQGQAYDPRAREALALVLEEAADAVTAVGAYAAGAPGDGADEALQARRVSLRLRRDELSALLHVDPVHDEAAWQQHGALLASIDRLRVEIDAAAAAPPVDAGPLHGRQALRRALVPASRSTS